MAEEKVKEKLRYLVPKKIGDAMRLLDRVRATQDKFASKAESEKRQAAMIETALLNMFKKDAIEGLRVGGKQATIKRSDVYTIKDFDKTWEWAVKTDARDIFHKRLSSDAVRARLKEGKAVPGMEVFTRVGISLVKVKK